MFLFLGSVGLEIALFVGWWATKLTFRLVYYSGSYMFYYYNSNRLIEYKA